MPASDFVIGGPRAAFWIVASRTPDGRAVAAYRLATNGNTFVRLLQEALQDEPEVPSFDGHRYGGQNVSVDGRWGPITSRVLWNALRRAGAPADALTSVAYDAGWRGSGRALATPALRHGSVKSAIWLLHRAAIGAVGAGVPIDLIGLGTDVIPPVWRVESSYASDGGDSISVTSLLAPEQPAPGQPAPPAPAPIPVAPEPVAPPADAAPASVPDPAPAPAPPREVVADIRQPIPWTWIVVGGAAVLAVVAGVVMMGRKPAPRTRRRLAR